LSPDLPLQLSRADEKDGTPFPDSLKEEGAATAIPGRGISDKIGGGTEIARIAEKWFMRQMTLEGLTPVEVDFDAGNIPATAKILRPVVWRDGPSVCVVLGPDPAVGVFGCGDDVGEALRDWDHHLNERIRDYREGDEVAEFAVANLERREEGR
jgi:hypothetical protein